MTIFWGAVAAMIAVALIMLLFPLLKIRNTEVGNRDALNVSLFNDRLAELEAERREGLLDDAQFAQARTELERDLLLNTTQEDEKNTVAPSGRNWIAAATVAVAVPLLAVSLYKILGSPELVDAVPEQSASHTSGDMAGMGDMNAMVERLKQRLAKNPEDGEGWVLLGRSFALQNRFNEAQAAFDEAVKRMGEDPSVLAAYAEVAAMAQNAASGKPAQLAQRALQLDPNSAQGLWIAGMGAFEEQDYSTALKYWEQLLPQMQPGSGGADMVGNHIAEARRLGGLGAATAASGAQNGDARSLIVRVSIAPSLAAKVRPEDVVFVMARAKNAGGPPLAVKRLTAGELPASIILDDSSSMGGVRLSSVDEVTVVARVSKDGKPMAKSGDLEASRSVKLKGKTDVALDIEKIVP